MSSPLAALYAHLPALPLPPASRRRLTPLLALLASLSFLLLLLHTLEDRKPQLGHWLELALPGRETVQAAAAAWGGLSTPTVRGPAEAVLQGGKAFNEAGSELWSLPDRLRPDERYLIAGHTAGWTNQVMSSVHAIHLALLTNRTPIIPYYHGYPSQLGGDDLVTPPLPNLAFSEIFDLPRLFASLCATRASEGLRGIVDVAEILEINREERNGGRGWPVRHPRGEGTGEGREVFGKGGSLWDDEEGEMWEAGCWRAHQGGLYRPMRMVRLEPTFSRLPLSALPHNSRQAVQRPLWPGLQAVFSAQNESDIDRSLAVPNATDRGAVKPNAWVACIDSIYYAVSAPSQSLWQSWTTPSRPTRPSITRSPLDPPTIRAPPAVGPDAPGPWETVGQYVHWEPELEQRGKALARQIFGVGETEGVPAFISVHIRHGDFLRRCDQPHNTCFSLRAFSVAVTSLRTRFLAEHGIDVEHVLLTTDESDRRFLEDVDRLGWKRVSEELSLEVRRELGDWFPMLLDNVLLSLGIGFVGTADSTMSLLNGRRVEYWNGGLAAYVDKNAPEN